jgi:multicomponent Na+:H+ antiporter subunit D
MPSLLILVPLVILVIFNLPFGKRLKNGFFWVALAMFVIDIVFVIFRIPFIKAQFAQIDSFFRIDFDTNALSFVVLFSINIVTIASLIVARSVTSEKDHLFNIINLLIVSTIGMNGVVLAKDLFTLYIFIEITSITSFILISIKKNLEALYSSFKYILLSAIASILMILSIALFFLIAGGTSYDAISAAIKIEGNRVIATLAILCFTGGLFIKGGLVPFHGWLPDAYSTSPSSISILLSGIVTKVCGAYVIIRLYAQVFGEMEQFRIVLIVVGLLSIVVGALTAIGQTNYKRLFAFSSVSQVGYIILGIGCGTKLGIIGAIFHLFNHAMFKSLLFVNASSIENATNETDMTKLGGLQKKMPVTSATSIVALLSAAGVPPLAGFWSKLLIIIALWSAGYYVTAIIAIVASVITLGYLLLFQRNVFFGKLREGFDSIREAPAGVIVVSVVLAVICVIAAIVFPFILDRYGMDILNIL